MTAVTEVIEGSLDGRSPGLAWSDWIRGEPEARPRRLLRVQPAYAFDQLNPAGDSIDALRQVFRELGLDGENGASAVRSRMTGVYVLAQEESEHVSRQSTVAGILSFLLVAIVLGIGLRSWRVVLAALATLIMGLVATASLASLVIGRLNLISVAFAVLFIGLSVDFAIHLGLQALESMRSGLPRPKAIATAAHEVGGSLVLCATTTAIGFYAFGPTAYRGVAELGLIAGTGMFVSLAANLTILPALLVLGSHGTPGPPADRPSRPLLGGMRSLPARGRTAIIGLAMLAAVASLSAIPRLRFDANPIRLREPSAPSVMLFDELLEDGDAVVWNVSALAPDAASAQVLAERLERLESVDRTLTLADFVPPDQPRRLAILDDLAYLLEPALAATPVPAPGTAQRREALERLLGRIRALANVPDPSLRVPLSRLERALDAFLAAPDPPSLHGLETPCSAPSPTSSHGCGWR